MRIQDKYRDLINIWIIFIIISLSIVIGITCVAISSYSHSIALKNQCKTLNKEIERLEENRIQVQTSKKKFNLGDDKLSTILSTLTSASKKSKASLGEISISEEIERGDYKVLPITLAIKGNYNQIGRFINTIERKDIRFQFWEIELSTKETMGRGIICKIKGEFVIL